MEIYDVEVSRDITEETINIEDNAIVEYDVELDEKLNIGVYDVEL